MEKILLKIKVLIKEKDLSIFKLTELAGLSENTIYNWYNRGAEPSIRALKAICPYLQVSLAQLVSESEEEASTYLEQQLIEYFRRLSEGKKDVIVKLVKEIAEN